MAPKRANTLPDWNAAYNSSSDPAFLSCAICSTNRNHQPTANQKSTYDSWTRLSYHLKEHHGVTMADLKDTFVKEQINNTWVELTKRGATVGVAQSDPPQRCVASASGRYDLTPAAPAGNFCHGSGEAPTDNRSNVHGVSTSWRNIRSASGLGTIHLPGGSFSSMVMVPWHVFMNLQASGLSSSTWTQVGIGTLMYPWTCARNI